VKEKLTFLQHAMQPHHYAPQYSQNFGIEPLKKEIIASISNNIKKKMD
jgi:hypothetical protein